MSLMSRNGRIPPPERDWYDESDEPDITRPDPDAGRPVRVSPLTGGGLTLAVLVVLGLIWIAREPEKEKAKGRFHRMPTPLGSVAFAPDGKTLALVRSDGGVVIESVADGRDREIEAGPGLGTLGRGLAYSPDGRMLASNGGGSLVKLWDAASGSVLASLEGHSTPVASLAFSPDGKILATGSLDGSVKLWDVAQGRELKEVAGHTLDIRGLAFSPDGKTLASGSLDGSVKLWDVAQGRELASVQGGGRRVYSLAFAPDGKSLALGLSPSNTEANGEVVLWYPTEAHRRFRVLGTGNIVTVAFSPDGLTLAAAGGDRVVKLWDIETGQELASLAGHEGFISSLAFSPDGRTLVTAGQDNLVGLFEIDPTKLKPATHSL
jgi:WD40 repeat protein